MRNRGRSLLTSVATVPELPEVESARSVIERTALGRRIVDVDDSDTYECRPHRPGEIRSALLGRTLTVAHRRGKSMWCDTSGVGRSRTPGRCSGIHLGMSGKIVIADGRRPGDRRRRLLGTRPGARRLPLLPVLADVRRRRRLLLVDPRRLGRVRLDPPVERLGPDAREITPAQFRAMMARGTAPVKARLLDQEAIAGIGNLLADQALWLAKINPARPVRDLCRDRRSTGSIAAYVARSARRSTAAACTRCRSSRSARPTRTARGAARR